MRALVKKSISGDAPSYEELSQKCKEDEDYRQIAKKLYDFLTMKNKNEKFTKVDYKKEVSNYKNWPIN